MDSLNPYLNKYKINNVKDKRHNVTNGCSLTTVQTFALKRNKKIKKTELVQNKYFPNLCHPAQGRWFDSLKFIFITLYQTI